jgi:hypothetical protein
MSRNLVDYRWNDSANEEVDVPWASLLVQSQTVISRRCDSADE